MIISVNWLKKFAKIGEIKIEDLCEKIGARLVEIENVENLAEKFRDVIIAKVVSCEKIPETHLHLCKIDDNGVRQPSDGKAAADGLENVARDENGFVQVVCGAPNIRENLLVAWLPPQSIVPETFATDDEFKLDSRKLRGEISHGMIASPRELGLWDEHEGILEICDLTDENSRKLFEISAKNSDEIWREICEKNNSFAKIFELDDFLLEVENKSLTHRPDCFGIVGFAREVAAICGKDFRAPEYFREKIEIKTEKILANPQVEIADENLCNRYECVVLTDVNSAKKSDLLREIYLAKSGQKPISASVDITNYLMFESGQPLHAFDFDKLCAISPTKKPEILVRAAKSGEKLQLLDLREIDLNENDIVICVGNSANSIPIALAGAMGGISTAIDENSRNILLESATFNLFNLRGTQFRHGVFSEAITRFTKGQPAELTHFVLREAAREFAEICGAKIASEIVDNYAKKTENPEIEISRNLVNEILGTNYSRDEILKVLRDLDYEISEKNDKIFATAPWWRTDVKIREDVVEDVGRVNGFDEISPTLPTRNFAAVAQNNLENLKQNLREILASFGANEVLTYTFVPEKLLQNVGQNSGNSYKIVNSISPDLQFVRQQIVPSLLTKTYENLKAGFDDFALFEMNQVFLKDQGLTDEEIPKIFHNLGFVLADKNSEINFYDAKNYLVKIGEKLGVKFDFRAMTVDPIVGYFEPKRSADVFVGETLLGTIGEIKKSVLKNFKLAGNVAIFEIGLHALLEILPKNATKYSPISKFQGTSRDLTLQVSREKTFAEVENSVHEILNNLPENFATSLMPIDIFAPNSEEKNITFHIEFNDQKKTIDTDFVNGIVERIAENVAKKLNGKII